MFLAFGLFSTDQINFQVQKIALKKSTSGIFFLLGFMAHNTKCR